MQIIKFFQPGAIKLPGLVFFLLVLFQFNLGAQTIRSHTRTPKVIKDPASKTRYTKESRKFTGIPSTVVSAKGVMWATWYAGLTPGEDANNYVVLAASTDQGKTWKEVLVVDPDESGEVRAYDPEIWLDPDQRLWLFWSQAPKLAGQSVFASAVPTLWALKAESGDDPSIEWSAPQFIMDGVMMCKPTVLSSGEWALPVSTWRLTRESAKMVVTTDKGNTWQIRGAVDVPDGEASYDEHMIVERKDGSLWMLIRTRSGIGESFSTDRGKTWAPMRSSKIIHTSSRFFIRRLQSGNLLLVKHAPINRKIGRSHLMAFISKDDGETWSKGLLLDERPGVSYPDGHQTEDGRIYLIYDYNRTKDQHIILTHFLEEDVLAENYDEKIVEIFANRILVSKGGEIKDPRTANFPSVVEPVPLPRKKENIWVFILAGQSNMAGRGLVEPSDTIPDSRILSISPTGELIYAKEPLHFYEPNLQGLDCGLSFARTLIRHIPDSVKILLIPTAVGGSAIGQWVNDSTFRNVPLLTNFNEKVEIASRYGVIKGILWHQGESDSKPDRLKVHAQQLNKLFTHFRSKIKNNSLPIFIGGIGPFQTGEGHIKMNEVLKKYTETDPHAYWVPAHDLTDKGDGVHFDGASLRELGRRYAETYRKNSR